MLIFSKLKGGYWPNCELVADKCFMTVQDDNSGKDCTQYLAGSSPIKGGGMGVSAKKGRSNSKMKNTPMKTSMKADDSFIQPAPIMQAEYDEEKVDEEPLRKQEEEQAQ
jgi:hypothetical protein